MSQIPKGIKRGLTKEAHEWDKLIEEENLDQAERALNEAEPFKALRPARQPVSIRLDPFDISMIKRIAREKGVPHTTLMAAWLHEKVENEKNRANHTRK
jgi:predicted DNA binding CopG/RHH family protein